MSLDDFMKRGDSPTREDVEETVTEATGIEPIQYDQHSSYYPEERKERGKCFAMVTDQPLLLFDPTEKETVFGQLSRAVREHPHVEEAGSDSLRYAMRFDDQIPDIAKQAVEESYDMVNSPPSPS